MGVRWYFGSMFGRVHTISKKNRVVSRSLNYVESYEIDEWTSIIFSCSRVRCTYSLEHEVCLPTYTSRVQSWWSTLHNFCTVWTSLVLVWFIIWLQLAVNRFMEPVKAKKFVLVVAWWRIEEDTNRAVNEISETFSSTGFGVEVIKLHVWTFIHYVKCFTKMNLMDNGDKDANRPGWGFYTVYQEYFCFCLIYLI